MASLITRMDPLGFRLKETVLISDGVALSDVVKGCAGGYIIGSIEIPSNYPTDTMSVRVAYLADGPWLDLYTDDDVEVVYSVTPGRVYALPDALYRGYPYLVFRSGPSSAPVAATEDVVLTLIHTRGVGLR
jgi:hypothetical protein